MEGIVSLRDIRMSFGKETVLQQINLNVQEGEILGLLGPSGSGKTTMVKIIAGILQPTEGRVRFNGKPVPSLEQMRQIGYMAQSDALYGELTAYENFDFFASVYGLSKKERKHRIEQAAKIVDLAHHLQKPVENFSGGMKRRMSLAIALLHEPRLLILDEPTVGIDPVLRQSIWQQLQQIRESGTTIIVTTHVMDEAERCDRLALIRGGQLIAEGTPEQLKEKSRTSTIEEAFLHYGGARS